MYAIRSYYEEGIAMQLTEDPWPEIEQAKETASVQDLIPLLQEEWTTLPNESLPMAYLAAHSATETFVNTYSMYSLRQVIRLISDGHTLDQAMTKKFSVSYETFRSRWQENYSASVRITSYNVCYTKLLRYRVIHRRRFPPGRTVTAVAGDGGVRPALVVRRNP